MMTRGLVFVFLTACASSRSPSAPGVASNTPGAPATEDRRCVNERGCAATPPLPVCEQRGQYNVPQLRRLRHSHDGKVVTTYGTLSGVGRTCTEMACGAERPCCNACDGVAAFSEEHPPLVLAGDPAFSCSGDDTGVCCGVPLGVEVGVTGTLVLQGEESWELRDAVLCRFE
jgi:hypothetical protein